MSSRTSSSSKRARTSTSSSSSMVAAKMRAARRRRVLPGSLTSKGHEIKAIDIPNANYSFLTAAAPPALTLLNGIQTGSGFFNRIGSRIEMKSLHVRGVISNIATGVQCLLRMLIFYDRQPNGAAPAYTTLMQSRDQTGAATTGSVSEINLDQRDRFVMIRDKTWFAPSATNTTGVLTNGPNYPGNDQELDIDMFISLKGLLTHFNATANPATIAEINSGALFVTFVTGGTTATWQASVGFRLRYDDY